MAIKKQETEQTQPPPDNVDQIREILFGNQIRAVDERFQSVEKRMSRESEGLRKTLENRIHDLEKFNLNRQISPQECENLFRFYDDNRDGFLTPM